MTQRRHAKEQRRKKRRARRGRHRTREPRPVQIQVDGSAAGGTDSLPATWPGGAITEGMTVITAEVGCTSTVIVLDPETLAAMAARLPEPAVEHCCGSPEAGMHRLNCPDHGWKRLFGRWG
jgi:hypothetical protein